MSKTMKVYGMSLMALVFVIAVIGFIGPELASAKDDAMVLIGLGLVFCIFPVLLWIANRTYTIIKKEK